MTEMRTEQSTAHPATALGLIDPSFHHRQHGSLHSMTRKPNARHELRPEAGATRRLEAVSGKALFGQDLLRGHRMYACLPPVCAILARCGVSGWHSMRAP